MGKRLVLNFHGIGEPHDWVDQSERRFWCTERNFLSILDTVPQASEELRIPIDLTFDDGNVSDIEVAAPALQERGMSAVFFVCAGRIGKPGYLDASQMQDLAGAGMTIGSHGWDHVDWRRLTDNDALHREVYQARDFIEDTVAQPVESVAIPFGSYDHRVWKTATKAFSAVYTSDGGLAPRSRGTVPRASYTADGDSNSLPGLAARGPLLRSCRRALAMAYKRHRSPQRAALPTTARSSSFA